MLDCWFSTMAGAAPVAVTEPSANSTSVGAPGTGSHGPCSERMVTVASTRDPRPVARRAGKARAHRSEIGRGVVRIGDRPHHTVVGVHHRRRPARQRLIGLNLEHDLVLDRCRQLCLGLHERARERRGGPMAEPPGRAGRSARSPTHPAGADRPTVRAMRRRRCTNPARTVLAWGAVDVVVSSDSLPPSRKPSAPAVAVRRGSSRKPRSRAPTAITAPTRMESDRSSSVSRTVTARPANGPITGGRGAGSSATGNIRRAHRTMRSHTARRSTAA